MMKRTSPCNKRKKVSGCASSVADHRPKEEESFESIMKKAGFDLGASSSVRSGRSVLTKRKFTSTFGGKVKPLSLEEVIKLMPSNSHASRRQFSYSSGYIQMTKPWSVYKQSHSPKPSFVASLRAKTHREGKLNPAMPPFITPREKVLEVLPLFKLQFEALVESKAATSSIDYHTRRILVKNRKQLNGKKMIGPVPGIEVGDEFQFKAELNFIGLHFNMRGGIDYITEGGMKIATSIVESKGNGYADRCDSNVMIYYGQGGNVRSNDTRVIEDQKLVNGNEALANSMKVKTPVRVIHGRKISNQRGKRYVYDGLYMVQGYRKDRGPSGNILYEFKLCRVSGQPSVGLKH